MTNENEKNPWIKISDRVVYDNPWIKVSEHQVRNFAGKQGIYGTVSYKNLAVCILPTDKNLNTWLVGQYRYGINEYSWEIPQGGCNPNEDPLEAAERELLEETGLKAKKWTKLQEVFPSNSISDEKAVIYLARDLTQYEPEPEEDEILQIKQLPFKRVYEMVINGEIKDAQSVVAILRFYQITQEGFLGQL